MLLSAFVGKAQTSSISTGNEIDEVNRPEMKKNVVKLRSVKETSVVVIRSHRNEDVQIYIFDLSGTIIHQGILKSKQKHRVENVAKGTYTYTIFQNDESVEEGQLIIK